MDSVVVPALVSLSTALIVTTSGWWWTLRRQRQEERRRRFAEAFAAVMAYREFPYAIRRRAATNPEDERVRLSEALRHVQERLSFHTVWIRVEDPRVAVAYEQLVTETRRVAGAAMHQAWMREPIMSDHEMNIAGLHDELAQLDAPAERFLQAVQRQQHPFRTAFGRLLGRVEDI
jgi:hypothetical protein